MVPVSANLRGFGDAPVVSTPSQGGAGEIVFGVDPADCRVGTTWDPTNQICAPNPPTDGGVNTVVDELHAAMNSWFASGPSAAGPQIKVGQAPGISPVAGAIGKIFTFTGLLTVAVLGAAGYGGYRYYKKHHRK